MNQFGKCWASLICRYREALVVVQACLRAGHVGPQ